MEAIRTELLAAALSAFWSSHKMAPHRASAAGAAARREEHFVAELLLSGVPILGSLWTPLFARMGASVRLHSVFVHKRPLVEFPTPGGMVRCELGDLLLVVRDRRLGFARACLFQAKMGATPSYTTRMSNPQDYLYATWPEFDVCSRPFPLHQYRLGRIFSQSSYLVVRDRCDFPEDIYDFPLSSPYASFQAVIDQAPKALAAMLVDMLFEEAGRAIYEPVLAGCDWSLLVTRLEDITAKQVLRAWKVSGSARGVIEDFCYWPDIAAYAERRSDLVSNVLLEPGEDDARGISLMVVDIGPDHRK